MRNHQRHAQIEILNAQPGTRDHTTARSAASLVNRGHAQWADAERTAILINDLGQAIREAQSYERIMDAELQHAIEANRGRVVGWDWRARMSGMPGVRVMQARAVVVS